MRFQEKYIESSQIGTKLQEFFDKSEVESLAKASKFVQRLSELTGTKFANLCICGLLENGMKTTLNELCCIAIEMGVNIRPQSLDERFNSKAVVFMKQLFERAMALSFNSSNLEILKEFSQLLLQDSTVCSLPENLTKLFKGCGGGASKAGVKIDCLYDYKSADFTLQPRAASQPDSTMVMQAIIPKSSLTLRDLGYFKTENFQQIEVAEAFYISRLLFNVKVYLSNDKDAQALDLPSVWQQMKEEQIFDTEVFIGQKTKFPTRLVFQKLPKEVADAKKKKLIKDKKKKGKTLSKERLAYCEVNAFITNLDAEKWPPQLIMKIYKVRWQVEILFKVWKSILNIGPIHKMKPDRFLCLLYGQLIWALINMKIFQSFKAYFWNNHQIEISEIKAYNIMKTQFYDLKKAIFTNCLLFYEYCLDNMFIPIKQLGRKQYKKGNPNPLFDPKNPLA